MKHARTAIAALSVSAAAFVALISHEGWTERAVIPVKGDVPTVGPGLTKRADGTPVQMGDTIKPVEGVQRSLAHLQRSETRIKHCVRMPLYQAEYDLLLDHAYQYGESATCNSPMVRSINAGRYAESCAGYLSYRYMTSGKPLGDGWVAFQFDPSGAPTRWRFDCSTPGNRSCYGVWTRSQERHDKCMAAQ
jgi:lysozyme